VGDCDITMKGMSCINDKEKRGCLEIRKRGRHQKRHREPKTTKLFQQTVWGGEGRLREKGRRSAAYSDSRPRKVKRGLRVTNEVNWGIREENSKLRKTNWGKTNHRIVKKREKGLFIRL